MSKAEVSAYLLGAQVEADVWLSDKSDADIAIGLIDSLTVDQVEALCRLGPDAFAYWVLRGATEAAEGRGK